MDLLGCQALQSIYRKSVYSRVEGALDGGRSVGDPGPLDAVRGHALRGHRGGVRLVGQRVHNQAEAGFVKTCHTPTEDLLVRDKSEGVNLRHKDAGWDHVELDVDQEWTQHVPVRKVTLEIVLLEYWIV